MKTNYTYLITYSDGKLYHGVRSCEGDALNDTYMGSSKYTPEGGVKTILTTHETREEAMQEEISYHAKHNVKLNDKYFNRCNAKSTGFDVTGTKNTEETKRRKAESKLGNSHPLGCKRSAETRRKMGAHQIGKGNRRAISKVVKWTHEVYGEFTLDKFDLIEKISSLSSDARKSHRYLSMLINDTRTSYDGWSLVK